MLYSKHQLCTYCHPPSLILLQQLGDTTPQVRDASAEALATVWKVMGDRPMTPYLEGLDKTKMTKVCRQS